MTIYAAPPYGGWSAPYNRTLNGWGYIRSQLGRTGIFLLLLVVTISVWIVVL